MFLVYKKNTLIIYERVNFNIKIKIVFRMNSVITSTKFVIKSDV